LTTTTHEDAKNDSGELSAMQSTQLGGAAVPDRVLLAPWGDVESTNGSFVVDEESAELASAAFADHATDTPIDYEHQTLGGSYASPNGQAPAAGWIKSIEAEPGVGLVASIEWTEQARQMLAAKEYRYLSPVALIRKRDRKLIGIHSAALTNKPAIKGMQPIVNRDETGRTGDLMQGDVVESFVALREELALPEDVSTTDVLLAANRRLIELRHEANRARIDQHMTEAMRAGKLVEAQRDWAAALIARDERLFDEWLRTAPVVVASGATRGPAVSDGPEQRSRAAESRARAEFRANPLLARLTSEAAYVARAARDAQCSAN